jgi:hypothetical protein
MTLAFLIDHIDLDRASGHPEDPLELEDRARKLTPLLPMAFLLD